MADRSCSIPELFSTPAHSNPWLGSSDLCNRFGFCNKFIHRLSLPTLTSECRNGWFLVGKCGSALQPQLTAEKMARVAPRHTHSPKQSTIHLLATEAKQIQMTVYTRYYGRRPHALGTECTWSCSRAGNREGGRPYRLSIRIELELESNPGSW